LSFGTGADIGMADTLAIFMGSFSPARWVILPSYAAHAVN
jgi:hypothetical protein